VIDFDEDEEARGTAPEMNTTPLIDVLLVLLIMIIVTIPLRPHLTELFSATRSTVAPSPPVVARVDIDADGVARWDGAVVNGEEIEVRLDALAASDGRPELHLRVNGETGYGRVMTLLSAVRRRETIKFGLVGTAR